MANPIMNLMGGNMPPFNNPMMQLIMAVKSGNPSQALQSIVNQNPKISEAVALLQGKTPRDMEAICRTLCQQRGMNFDNMLNQINNMMR